MVCRSATVHLTRSISQEEIYHEKLARLPEDKKSLEAVLGTEQRFFSFGILESNVTYNKTRCSASFNTVPPIVNWGDW